MEENKAAIEQLRVRVTQKATREAVELLEAQKKVSFLRKPATLPAPELQQLLQGRQFVKVSTVQAVIQPDYVLERDWVTIGILLNKSVVKKSKTGNNFITFSLGDFSGKETKFFLFGTAFDQWWTLSKGTVIGVLNAEYMAPLSEGQDPSYKITCAGKVIEVGAAFYFGTCIGITGNKKCEEPANL